MPEAYANRAILYCDESAANTLTFRKLDTGIALFEKVAWVIHRIDYYVSSLLAAQFDTNGDQMEVAITCTDQLTSISTTQIAVLDTMTWQRHDFGAAATGWFITKPVTREWSALPGGGILTPPNPLFMAVRGTGLVAASHVWCRMWYSTVQLKADEYWELVESMRMII